MSLFKNLLEFLNRQMEGSIEKYEAAVNILEEEEQLEERSLLQSPNQYVFGVIRILVESEAVYAVSRRRSAPPVFYPQKREDYHKLRNAVARSRETLTGTKELTRIMFEEIIKAIEKGRHFTYIMTYNGLLFFFEKYKECFGSEMAIEYIKALPTLLEQSRHKVFVIEETNPLTMYASEKQIALVITESRGEIAGIQTNKKEIVDSYLQLFREMLSRSKPIQHYLDRIVI